MKAVNELSALSCFSCPSYLHIHPESPVRCETGGRGWCWGANTSPPGQAPWAPASGVTHLLLALLRVAISTLALVSRGGRAGRELVRYELLLDDECSHLWLWSDVSWDNPHLPRLGGWSEQLLPRRAGGWESGGLSLLLLLVLPSGTLSLLLQALKVEEGSIRTDCPFRKPDPWNVLFCFSQLGTTLGFYGGEWERRAVSAPGRTGLSLKKGAVWLRRKKWWRFRCCRWLSGLSPSSSSPRVFPTLCCWMDFFLRFSSC